MIDKSNIAEHPASRRKSLQHDLHEAWMSCDDDRIREAMLRLEDALRTNAQVKPDILEHHAFHRTWWMNLYPSGEVIGTLYHSRGEARKRCSYWGETPNATQIEVRIVPITAA